MKPFLSLVEVTDHKDGKCVITRDEYLKALEYVYNQGVEDGKNKALADLYKEQLSPYKYISYPATPTTAPYYKGIDITCSTEEKNGLHE